MAERVTRVPSSATSGVYPWAEWFDGSAWELRRGVDFTTTPASFRTSVHSAANLRGLRAVTRVKGDLFYLQVVPR